MEELSSAESGRFGLPQMTSASAAAAAARRRETASGATTTLTSTPSFSAAAANANTNRSSLSGSLRDIQQLMDEQVRRIVMDANRAKKDGSFLASTCGDQIKISALLEEAERRSKRRQAVKTADSSLCTHFHSFSLPQLTQTTGPGRRRAPPRRARRCAGGEGRTRLRRRGAEGGGGEGGRGLLPT